MSTQQITSFDAPERLNEDGTVTFKIIPSNWHAYNISPDTYQMVNGDSVDENTIEYFSQETGRDLSYDDLTWAYDHAGIVRGFAEELSNWISEQLMEAGVESLSNVSVTDTWSPPFYNFQSDGFEIEMTLDPAELRALTSDFDVEVWAREYYSSYDGFASYVTGRMHDPDWQAIYDGEFRVESLLAGLDEQNERGWMNVLFEAEHEVYSQHTTVELKAV